MSSCLLRTVALASALEWSEKKVCDILSLERSEKGKRHSFLLTL